ncbi:hypothetical protein H4R18_002531 [Coemansia javaensis]|uniref:Nucleoside phosphorylase domain-containing protein n=1 Tax=Coemansia javaensis TaxID=2761396 RepID=A0A9W8HCS4_9FUNG|nr:hypothetical protein H4R18_002531 [Coemansia javaensis]
MNSANKPVSSEGRTYHVETREGEVANRVITVGDAARARALAKHLDRILFERASHRGFLTITGMYRGVPVSIVAIGMGQAMMDFFVRETRMVVRGPLTIVRFGSCGSICPAKIGDLVVASSAFAITRNFAFFGPAPSGSSGSNNSSNSDGGPAAREPYLLWPAVPSDPGLTQAIAGNLRQALGDAHVYEGAVGNADSFYGSQGREGSDFYDANGTLIRRIHAEQPDAAALEMESHMLFHLAHTSTGPAGAAPPSIRAACALMVYADRAGNAFIAPETSARMVNAAARAILDALVDDAPTQDGLHPSAGAVWEAALAA